MRFNNHVFGFSINYFLVEHLDKVGCEVLNPNENLKNPSPFNSISTSRHFME